MDPCSVAFFAGLVEDGFSFFCVIVNRLFFLVVVCSIQFDEWSGCREDPSESGRVSADEPVSDSEEQGQNSERHCTRTHSNSSQHSAGPV